MPLKLSKRQVVIIIITPPPLLTQLKLNPGLIVLFASVGLLAVVMMGTTEQYLL